MNFEMYSAKKLLTSYLDDYFRAIERIQYLKEQKSNVITSISQYEGIFDLVYSHHFNQELSRGKTDEQAHEIASQESSNSFDIINKLNECLWDPKNPYTEEELNHIYLSNKKNYVSEEPYIDVALKRFLFSLYGTTDVKEIIKQFDKEKSVWTNSLGEYEPFIQVLNKQFETKKDISEFIYKTYEENFIKEFNCGGYALEIFDWVSCERHDHDQTVSILLQNPSVRLLGDTKLEDDEYLVVLDATSYHFIKQMNGKFVEKMRSVPCK